MAILLAAVLRVLQQLSQGFLSPCEAWISSQLSARNSAQSEHYRKLAAAARLSALGEMAGGIAHEINNPLAIITLHASQLVEMLEEQSGETAVIIDRAKKIELTAHRIARIVKSLRVISRDAKDDPFATSEIKPLIYDTLELCQEKFRQHGVLIKIVDAHLNARIDCRPSEISQVLLNLLNNSFDAVERLEEKWIEIAVRESVSHLEIVITDSGRGITDEVREKLFRPFFTTKDVGKGTGLGLSISQSIIRNHGGDLSIERNFAHTRFVIRLPVSGFRELAQKAA